MTVESAYQLPETNQLIAYMILMNKKYIALVVIRLERKSASINYSVAV